MTNQNTALREHEPPTEPERLRSSSSQLLQKGDHQLEAASASHNNNKSSAITPPVSVALKNSLNANPGLSVTSNHNSSGNHSPASSPHPHKGSRDKRPASRGSQEVEGARESASAPFPSLYQPYNPVFSGNHTSSSSASAGGGAGGSGPERCHTTSPIGMHHQQRLMSPTSPYFSSGSTRLMKSARDMHSMLNKRPLSADGGAAASEAKRSTRLMMDRTMRLRSPTSLEQQRREEEDEDEMETASDMRMATTDEDGEEEGKLRDSKRNIKLLHNSSRDEDRPRSSQHLESGE